MEVKTTVQGTGIEHHRTHRYDATGRWVDSGIETLRSRYQREAGESSRTVEYDRSGDGLLKWMTMLDEADGHMVVTTLEYEDGQSVGDFGRWLLQYELRFPI